jgi:mono/diheme cytochrome c family protein
MFPPLKGNANVQSEDPSSIIRVIVEGARTIPTDARPTPSSMPAYGWKLSNEQVAAVATYVRNAWGNAAPPVSASDVGKLKKDLASTAHAPPGEAR